MQNKNPYYLEKSWRKFGGLGPRRIGVMVMVWCVGESHDKCWQNVLHAPPLPLHSVCSCASFSLLQIWALFCHWQNQLIKKVLLIYSQVYAIDSALFAYWQNPSIKKALPLDWLSAFLPTDKTDQSKKCYYSYRLNAFLPTDKIRVALWLWLYVRNNKALTPGNKTTRKNMATTRPRGRCCAGA